MQEPPEVPPVLRQLGDSGLPVVDPELLPCEEEAEEENRPRDEDELGAE